AELDRLWEELDVLTLVPFRQYKDFIFFEREEPPMFMQERVFDFARSEDRDAASAAKIEQLRVAYVAKARRKGADRQAQQATETYFAEMSRIIRRLEQTRRDAEPSHLAALESFAARAYRRPLEPSVRKELRAFYRGLREDEGLSHEDALRDVVASVL